MQYLFKIPSMTLLTDFTQNPEYESGLINILEVLNIAGVSLESEMMTKRTIVAMGMKVRNKKLFNAKEESTDKKDHLNIMMASYLLGCRLQSLEC
jgi:hypothetical protein